MSATARLERAWHELQADAPGVRFRHQYERLRAGSRGRRVAQVAAGLALVAGGAGLLVAPGPGLLLIAVGLALIAGTSGRLARVLDRFEPWARDRMFRVRRRWWVPAGAT